VKVGLGVLGVLVALTGAAFAGQGLGYIAGSVMTGDLKWFWIGSAMVVAGLVLAWFGFLRRGKPA
jgi:uncharacterized membrane protein